MTYLEFKTSLQRHLTTHPSGATWQELRATLKLPYDRPCPEWTKRLEKEIGLVRAKGQGRSLVWSVQKVVS